METLGNANLLNSAFKYYCNCCDYGTSKKSSFNDHNLSAKHQKRLKCDAQVTQSDEIMPKICHLKYQCENCNKSYESRNGLWKHKNSNNCFKIENDNILQNDKSSEIRELKEIMKYLLTLQNLQALAQSVMNYLMRQAENMWLLLMMMIR
jgi:DNA replicative helicase MCM subunit Mcm2 (Cdc46/Mcm family)